MKLNNYSFCIINTIFFRRQHLGVITITLLMIKKQQKSMKKTINTGVSGSISVYVSVCSAMSLIEMSQQQRTTPARATFTIDFQPNDNNDNASDRLASQLVGSGLQSTTDHMTPIRRYATRPVNIPSPFCTQA